MPDPLPESRDQRPSRLAALFHRRWEGKDVAIAVLGLLFLSMSGYAFRGPLGHAFAKLKAGAKGGETVGVFEVIVDHEN